MNKKLLLHLRLLLLIAGTCFIAPVKSSASHFFGVDMRYDYVNATTYSVQLIAYGDCSGSSFMFFPTSSMPIFLYNGGTYESCTVLTIQAPTNGVEVTPVCPSQANQTWCINPNNPIPGIKKFVYQSNITVPSTSSDWRFIWQGNCGIQTSAGRSGAITNIVQAGQTNIVVLIDTLNNAIGPNTSPVLTSLPTPFFCLNSHYLYSPGAIDADGDSLMLFLVPGKNGNANGCGNQTDVYGFVTYNGGYTATKPLAVTANTFAYDSTDGQIAFTPNVTQRSLVVYNVEEWRHYNGNVVLAGTSQREMTFLVLTCENNPPTANIDSISSGGVILDSADIKICQSAGAFSFQLAPTAPLGDSITISWSGLPTIGAFPANITVVNNGGLNPVATFSWTTIGVPVGTYTFFVTYRSSTCPLNSTQTLAYRISVLPNPGSLVAIVTPSDCYNKGYISITPNGTGSPYNVSILQNGVPIQLITGITNTIYDSLPGSTPPGQTYTIRLFNQANCYHDTTITLINAPLDTPGSVLVNPLFCGDPSGSITLTGLEVGIPDTVSWKYNGNIQPAIIQTVSPTGTITISGLLAGYYDSIVTKYRYCSTPPVNDTLINPPFVISSNNFTNPTHCGVCDGTISLGGLEPGQTDTVRFRFNTVQQAPFSYIVPQNGIIVLTGLCAGIYDSIIVHTAGVCYSLPIGPFNLAQPPLVIAPPVITQPSACGICDGELVIQNLSALQTDTVRYQIGGIWQPYLLFPVSQDGDINLINLCPGVYDSISVAAGIPAGGCQSNYISGLNLLPPNIHADFTYNIHHSCSGADTVFFTNTSANGATITRWHFGDGAVDTVANPSHVYDTAGSYVVTLYASNLPCIDSISYTIDTYHPISAAFDVSADTLCQGGTVTFTNNSIGGNPRYYWNFGDGSVIDSINFNPPGHTYLNPGVYHTTLLEVDSLSCRDTALADIYVDPVNGASFTVSDTAICAGQEITFKANYSKDGVTGISWDLGDGNIVNNQNPVTHAYVGANLSQSVNVKLTVDYRICPDTAAKKTIHVIPYPAINLGSDTAICAGGAPIQITDVINRGNPLASWKWSTGETGAGITVSEPGLYYSTVTLEGCSNSDSVLVNNDCYIQVPNVFTPNGDGVNDYFFPRQWLTSGVTAFKMDIYNRWGQLIFETTNSEGLGWDGRLNNVMQSEGVYIYLIDVTFKDAKREHHQGNVTLLR